MIETDRLPKQNRWFLLRLSCRHLLFDELFFIRLNRGTFPDVFTHVFPYCDLL